MRRNALSAGFFAAFLFLLVLASPRCAAEQDINQHLRDQYQGKVFVLRGFPTGDVLHYDSSGMPPNSGDWTVDGFVQVNDIRISDNRLLIKAQRMAVVFGERKEFELRPLERAKPNNARRELVYVEIKADPGMHNPTEGQVDAVVSRIFLTTQDSFADALPDYWKPCVNNGLTGTNKSCAFAPELLTTPGVAPSTNDKRSEGSTMGGPVRPAGGVFRVGGGVSPPKALYSPEPAFSESARAARFQGVVTLGLIVSEAGFPTRIMVLSPLGYGLDAQAVEAVSKWRFDAAKKDGMPVPSEIGVEVNFHLY